MYTLGLDPLIPKGEEPCTEISVLGRLREQRVRHCQLDEARYNAKEVIAACLGGSGSTDGERYCDEVGSSSCADVISGRGTSSVRGLVLLYEGYYGCQRERITA